MYTLNSVASSAPNHLKLVNVSLYTPIEIGPSRRAHLFRKIFEIFFVDFLEEISASGSDSKDTHNDAITDGVHRWLVLWRGVMRWVWGVVEVFLESNSTYLW